MKNRGFTLVEMIVVITIITILTSVGLFSYNEASKKARDNDRKADLKTLQTAIELHKQKYGQYPVGCRGAAVWSGQLGTEYACSGGAPQYIVGLAPEFIPFLPQDKVLVADADGRYRSGYVYTTNTERTVYKLEAKNTVESETVSTAHPFKSCNVNPGFCDQVTSLGGNTPDHCQEWNSIFQKSYALWGGYATGASQAVVERNTENIICAIQ